ncbi:V-type ATP synthase subunit I [Streptococcus sp. S784/96/1]|uniref:V-type ATP synthase subunit I n=1 Tax=Streptococcus sp. S784/96/1 TaxID=2653499 RepID=UPI001386AFD9|nr:V-type ATP synthase subunit I [Streptococcus sp. S784/96/1]
MAVSKMQKLLILTDYQTRGELLKSVQEFQAFEPAAVEDMRYGDNTLSELTTQIQSLETELAQVAQAQTYLKAVTPKKIWSDRFHLTAQAFAKKMTEVRERDLLGQVLALQQKETLLQKQLADLDENIELANKWKTLSFLKKDRRALKATYAIIGTLPEDPNQEKLNQLLARDDFYVERLFQNDLEQGLVVYADRSAKHELKEFLDTLHFDQFDFPFGKLPAEQLEDFKIERSELLAEQKAGAARLKALSQDYADLMFLEEDLYNQKERLRAEQLLASGQELVGLSGWVREDDISHLKELLAETLPEGTYISLVDNTEVSEQEIPTQLVNHPLVEPFEALTEMYSLPKYSEVDPTPLLAPFYAVFFGMMAADVGYGLLLWFGTWYLLNKTKASKSARKNYKLFHILSYPTILWGLFFGSFFGIELPFHVLSTTTDVISILVLSVVFGLVQLLFGLAVNTQLQLKAKDYPSAISDGLGWIGLLVGVILLVLQNFTGQAVLGDIAKWLIILNVAMIILGTAVGSKNKLLGIGSGLYKLYGATSYIGDIASYTRLMALSVSGASIAASFNMVVGLLPPVARFTAGIPLIIALQMLNMGMSFLGAYVHAIRLQFVEFFGKFYEGGGHAFKPLKTYEKYTDLKTRKMEK